MMLNSVLPKERVSIRLIDRLAYAHDASMYRLVPEAVVRPRNDKDVSALMKHCYSNKIPVTFRAGNLIIRAIRHKRNPSRNGERLEIIQNT